MNTIKSKLCTPCKHYEICKYVDMVQECINQIRAPALELPEGIKLIFQVQCKYREEPVENN